MKFILRANTFTGIIAGTTIEDYQNNIIKKHEDTIQYRVELFKDYLIKPASIQNQF